jgi:hypothetical protein
LYILVRRKIKMDRLPYKPRPARGRFGPRHTPEGRERIRQWHLGQKLSDETRKKLSEIGKKRAQEWMWIRVPRDGSNSNEKEK